MSELLLPKVDIDIPLNDRQQAALAELELGLMICSRIRDGMYGGIARWVVWGLQPGDFLLAVLRGDLMSACGRADEYNQAALFECAKLLHNWCPGPCFGSFAAVQDWSRHSGLADDAQRAVIADRRQAALGVAP